MNDLLLGQTILNDTIANDLYHADYLRVTELAQEYYDIFTGAGIMPYLKKYRKNESDEQFNQLLEIYETTIPSTVNNLDTIFEKPLRSNRVYSSIEHKNNTARDEILERLQAFWQGETESGLDAYLRERWKFLNVYDPNAFIAIEFSNFNPVKEKAQPFALEYSSTQAIRFSYIKGILDWLICEKPIYYEVKNGEVTELVEGSRYIMYLENEALVYTEVDPVQRITPILNPVFVEIRKDPKSTTPDRVFVRQVFDTKSKVVPAFRVGYMLDPQTKSRTCLSSIHYALAFFKKELKSGAELDLTIRAHVFPQKFMYGPKCEGNKELNIPPCQNGKKANGGACEVCKGTGTIPVHTTASDLVVIPFPKRDNEPVINLQQAMAYHSPPLDLVKFMEAYSDRLTQKAKGAVFPSQAIASSRNAYSEDSGPTTATEQDYSWDNVYDTFRPFTAKYSYAWLFITKMTAIYTDNLEGLTIYHKFPSDYKLKPVTALMAEAKSADESNLPQHVVAAIHDDIANVYYADDQDTLQKITIKNKFHPFSGKTDAEIQAILASEEILMYYKILYIYFDIIFDLIEEELGDRFYLLTVEKQRAEIKKQVDKIIADVEASKAKRIAQAKLNIETDVEEEEEEEEPA